MKVFDQFQLELLELTYLRSTLAVLGWDEQVYMPPGGAEVRAKTTAYLAGVLHQKFTSKDFAKLLKEVKKLNDQKKLNTKQTVIFREVYREFLIEKKLPLEFVKELAETTSKAHHVWAKAREQDNFKLYLPVLKKIIALKKKEAEYLGYKDSPYDALLDLYEPYAKSKEISKRLEELKNFLVPFIKQIKNSKVKINPKLLHGEFPKEKQENLCKEVGQKLGFNFDTGRLDISHHPFTITFHPQDVRITTRFDEHNLMYALGSTIHEVGHGLYEQGLPVEGFGTPLGESISLGIHESQSRVWENQIGKSLSFWKYLYPILQKTFPTPFKKVKVEEAYKAVNFVQPSFIRTEADEVTYNLHIIIRFEIERDLMEGKIKNVEDLPKIWNQKYQDYLGVKVPNYKLGILQDVHWSGGSIGYFPTYSLGNLYSAQLFAKMKKSIPNIEKLITQGNFGLILKWLRENVHIHGKVYSADELVKKVTGEPLDSKYFIEYLNNKYSEIYQLK